MPTVGSFSVWVQVDNERLSEYAVNVSADGRKVTCWVPSEAGKRFEVCYADSQRLFSTRTSLWVDGVRSTGKTMHSRNDPGHKGVATHRGVSLSDNAYRPFTFADCELVEDEDFISTLSPGVGTIKCIVDEAELLDRASRHVRAIDLPPLRMQERAKKGVVHGTRLGQAVHTRVKSARHTRLVRKLISFKFKYRPLAVLIADDIAPRPQLPDRRARRPPTSRHEVIDLTKDYDDNAAIAAVKCEPKRERSITYHNDIIDLT